MNPVDPFDLPDWLGDAVVTWSADGGLGGSLVRGRLTAESDELVCDLMGVDDAYPAPVAPPDMRVLAHRAWRHGQILLATEGDRLAVLVPTTEFTADLVLEVMQRFARAVGADPAAYSARLRLSDRRPR